MINLSLSLIEFKTRKNKLIENNRPISYGFICNINGFDKDDFETNSNDNKTSVKNVTGEFVEKTYNINTKYAIIYLYDYWGDKESEEFIAEYGGKLCNYSSSKLTILTFFNDNVANNWRNVQERNYIKSGPANNYNDAYNIIEEMKKMYKINNLPAMIIIKNNQEGEEYFSIELSNPKKSMIFDTFLKVMEIIDDNCEENFSVIENKICGPDSKQINGYVKSPINTFYYVGDLVKNESKNFGKKYNLDSLAADLGVSESTLRNKRIHNTFIRDECIYIAVKFKISTNDLNELLMNNHCESLGVSGRDAIIRKCLNDEYDTYKTNEILIKNGYKGIEKTIDE